MKLRGSSRNNDVASTTSCRTNSISVDPTPLSLTVTSEFVYFILLTSVSLAAASIHVGAFIL